MLKCNIAKIIGDVKKIIDLKYKCKRGIWFKDGKCYYEKPKP